MNYSYLDTGNPQHPYKLEKMEVFFSDLSCLEIIKKTLDERGNICGFPGIVKDARWEHKHRIGQCYDARFEVQLFSIHNEQFLMLWMIQPSGWHWIDEDGFGFSGDSSIMLYSIIDGNGMFAKPFELFSIDKTRFCNEFDQYVGR